MELISEDRSSRIYRVVNGDHLEVRPQLRGRTSEMTAESYDSSPEIAKLITEMLIEGLLRGIAQQDEQTISEVDLHEERISWQPPFYDDNGDPILDEDGELTEDPDADPIEIVRLSAEVGVWPNPNNVELEYLRRLVADRLTTPTEGAS